MFFYCWRTYSRDEDLRDRLYSFVEGHGGWISITPGWIDYFVPEQYSEFFSLMADLTLIQDNTYID